MTDKLHWLLSDYSTPDRHFVSKLFQDVSCWFYSLIFPHHCSYWEHRLRELHFPSDKTLYVWPDPQPQRRHCLCLCGHLEQYLSSVPQRRSEHSEFGDQNLNLTISNYVKFILYLWFNFWKLAEIVRKHNPETLP